MTVIEHKLNEFYHEFEKGKKMVLSTSDDNNVSSRMMCVVLIDAKLYFQTDKRFRKYQQIQNNPNIALCIDNIQIEATCKEIGHPSLNKAFCKVFENAFKKSYDAYSKLDSEVLFEVEIKYIERWLYIDKRPYIEIFDLLANNYTLKAYN